MCFPESSYFTLANGVKHGGVISPIVLARK